MGRPVSSEENLINSSTRAEELLGLHGGDVGVVTLSACGSRTAAPARGWDGARLLRRGQRRGHEDKT